MARRHLSVRTASGRVSAGELDDGCELHTASGSQHVDRLAGGVAQLDTVSGDLLVAVARGALVDVDVQTTSGTLSSEIELDATEPPVTEPPVTEPPVTGLESAPGPDCAGGPHWPPSATSRIENPARTVSGDVRIQRASA